MPRTKNPSNGASGSPRTTRASKKTNGAAEQVNDPDAVARKAYEIFQNRGGDHGADLDDWLEAERQLKPEPRAATAPVPAKPRRRKSSQETA